MQKIDRQHGQRQREDQAFQNHYIIIRRARTGRTGQCQIGEAGDAAQHKNDKIAQEEALVPAANSGNDDGKPQPQHAQQQRRADD